MNQHTRSAVMRALGLGLFAALAVAPETQAADHFDGDVTAAAPASDIADFYAFPVERDGAPTRLALIMNTSPRAGVGARFSDAVDYGFRIRPGSLERTATGVATRVGDREFRIACGFDLLDGTERQGVTCTLRDGATEIASTKAYVDDVSGGPNPAFRVFAGPRADPFFTDAIRIRLPRPRYKSLPSIIGTGNSMRPAKTAVGVNFGGTEETQGQVPNVLSLVVELEVDSLLDGTGPKFAVVAETTIREEGEEQ